MKLLEIIQDFADQSKGKAGSIQFFSVFFLRFRFILALDESFAQSFSLLIFPLLQTWNVFPFFQIKKKNSIFLTTP